MLQSARLLICKLKLTAPSNERLRTTGKGPPSMNVSTLGTWRNPPLAYVVAELAISPYYSLAAKIPDLQDRLRIAYPRTVETQELLMDIGKPTPTAQNIWQLLSADQRHGVQFSTRSISIHATSYATSSDLLTRWAEVLDAIQASGLNAFVERAGLRYVDLIVPNNKLQPADYVSQQLQGITPTGSRSTGAMWAAAFQFDSAVVNLRVGAPAPSGILLPPNFNALPLQKPQVMLDAEARLKDAQPIGFIDTDCLKEVGQVFNAAALVSIYTEMQKLASQSFKAALSEVARKEWV